MILMYYEKSCVVLLQVINDEIENNFNMMDMLNKNNQRSEKIYITRIIYCKDQKHELLE